MEGLENQVEATQEPTQEQAPVPQERVSDRFSFLAKKEAGIVRQRQELKSQMESISAQRSEVEKLRQEIEKANQRKGSYKTNPLAVLEDHGLSYKELTDFILNNNTVSTETQIKAIQEKLEESEKRRELDRKESLEREQQRAAAREAQVIEEFKGEIGSYLQRESDKFELTNLYDSADLVYDTVEEYFAKTNKVLSIPEACDLVEAYLEKQVEKSLATKKLSSKVQRTQEPTVTPQRPAATQRTISNQQYTSSSPTLVSSPRVENDRIARAMAALDQ